MPVIAKVERESVLDSATGALRAYIIENRLKPGDRLPTEGDLSKDLGISRNIVREAMQSFRVLGIVKSKQKVGAVVGSLIPDDPFKRHLPFLAKDPICIKEAAQMRMALECGSAPFMVANCGPDSLARLQKLLDGLSSIGQTPQFDIEFHSELLRMTGNRLIESMIPLTVEFFTLNSKALVKKSRSDLRRIVREHKTILSALEGRDAAKLAQAFKAHYKSYFKLGDDNQS